MTELFLPGRVTVGVVGIGKMGTPMSRNLLKGDYAVVGYDIRPEALEKVRGDGVLPAGSLSGVAEKADVVITMLPDSDSVEEAVLGENGLAGHMAPGRVLIDMSSSYPARTKVLGEKMAAQGIRMLGAPVSGGVAGAEAGTLAIMVGGPKELAEAATPLLERLGKNIFHIDESIESGHKMKCINNYLSAANLLSSLEAVVLAVKAGLDPEKALDVFNAGTGMNSATSVKWPRFLLPRTFDSGFSVGLMFKDVSTASDMAGDLEADLPLLDHVRMMFKEGVERFGNEEDQTILLKMIEERAGQIAGEPPEENL